VNEPTKPPAEIQFRSGHYLALTKGRMWSLGILAPLLGVCAWAVSRAGTFDAEGNAWAVPLGNVGLTIFGVLVGLVLAPSPRPTDHADIAAIAVDEMAELTRSTDALVDRVANVAAMDELTNAHMAKVQLALVEQELVRQGDVQIREIARWSRVAPGSEDEIVKGRETTAAILSRLEKEQDIEREH
jgi:hypothetical protein